MADAASVEVEEEIENFEIGEVREGDSEHF
jgi:hypothetical protein